MLITYFRFNPCRSHCSFIGLLWLLCTATLAQSPSDSISFAPDRIQILRDAWGVAHIFAPTDAEVSYGLAWATAEDDFKTLQELLLQAKQLRGLYEGETGVARDFFVHFIQAEATVLHDWPKLSTALKRYLAGYCAGLNAYAKKHSDEQLLKALFPIRPQDLLKAYVLRSALLAGIDEQLQQLSLGKLSHLDNAARFGGTAYALHPSKTVEGESMLGLQAHFPLSGPLQLYEAHLHSDEGLNCTGALFLGDASIMMGSNTQLAWAQTLNDFDQIDIFELQMHPRRPLQYRYNGSYISLEKRPFQTTIRKGLLGKKASQMSYLSVYGPVIKSQNGRFYALRSPSFMSALGAEEYYAFNKASDWEEFQTALRIQGLPFFSLMYADRKGQLRFIANGLLPERKKGYNWKGILSGDTTATNWQTFYRLKELPLIEVDTCGYLIHSGQHPNRVSCANVQNIAQLKILETLPKDNNRSLRLRHLLDSISSWSFERLKRLPFDAEIQVPSAYWKNWSGLRALDPLYYPHLEANIRQLQSWSFSADKSDTTAALALLTLNFLLEKYSDPHIFFTETVEIEAQEWVNALQKASAYLLKHHNSTWLPLEKVMRWYNGIGVPTGTRAFPGTLNWAEGNQNAEGLYRLQTANSYLFFVRFNRRTVVEINSLRPFKQPYRSRKYINEAESYEERRYKYRSLERQYNLDNAVEIYAPGMGEKLRQIPASDR